MSSNYKEFIDNPFGFFAGDRAGFIDDLIRECTDKYNNVNLTKLAERLCAEYDLYNSEENVPDELYDIVFYIVEGLSNE